MGTNPFQELSMAHIALTHAKLHLENISDAHGGASFDLLKNHSKGQRTHLCHWLTGLSSELWVRCLQPSHDRLRRVKLENRSYLFQVLDRLRIRWIIAEWANDCIDLFITGLGRDPLNNFLLELRDLILFNKVRCDAPLNKVSWLHTFAAHAQVETKTYVVFNTRQEVRSSMIIEEAKTSFRHANHRVLCRHTDWWMPSKTNATTHAKPIPNRDLSRFAHLRQSVVKQILSCKVFSHDWLVCTHCNMSPVRSDDVTTDGESHIPSTTHHHDTGTAIDVTIPSLKLSYHQINHL